MMKRLHLLMMLLLVCHFLYGQQRTITGTVRDSDNNRLPGVNVVIKGTISGTVTDIEGKYSINVSENQNALVFSSVGYLTEEVDVTTRSVVDISLSVDITSLDEVVVVGYGTQRKVNITGSVEALKGQDIASQPVMQTSQALMGKAPGVTILQSSGQPGNDAGAIRIRGTGTLGNSNPLILIDGVPGDMNSIDPKDIEDISILKDAAASAIYGSRAANGVVLITTKRGEAGKVTLNYNGYAGFQSPTNLPDFVGGMDYMIHNNIARQNQGQNPLYSDAFLSTYQANAPSDLYPDVDWLNELFSESGFMQHHHVSASGGTDMAKVVGSISLQDQGGNVPGFNFKRYQARLNTDLKLTDKLDVNLDLNYRHQVRNEPPAGLGNTIRQGFRTPAIFPSRYSDGSWGIGWNGQNPVALSRDGGTNNLQSNYFRGLLRANYRPIKGMNISVMYSPEYVDEYLHNFERLVEYLDFETKTLLLTHPARNTLNQRYGRSTTHTLNGVATYEKQFGKHYFNVLGGYELITFRNDFFTAFRDNFPLQDYTVLDAGSRENMQNGGSASDWALQSYFTRVNYDYNGKYLLEGNLRYDGSSRFSQGNKYGVFPSFSAGWRISEEDFFSGVTFMDELKFRGSWGQLGNQNIGNYPFASVINLGIDYIFGGNPAGGAAQLALANQLISWETTETTNLGIDMAMFNNRFTTSFEYYVRNTYDILLNLPIPFTLGLNAPVQNAGVVRNTGWDWAMGWRDKKGDFTYAINFNLSDVQNRVMDLKGAGPFISGHNITQEGYPIGSIFGYQTLGFFQNQEDVDNSPRQFGTVFPGDLKYKNQLTVDTNGDGVPDAADDVINPADRRVIGDPFPRMTFGLNLYAQYKGFDLTVFAQGIGRRDLYLQQDAVWAFFNAGNIQRWMLDYWTPENPNASYPRLNAGTTHNNWQVNDFWVYDASYLRLRNLTLGYNFPQSIAQALGMSRLRTYFSGQNLFTLDNMPQGIDPEAPDGTNGTLFPITKVFTLGFDITF
ncbi:MAG: TonB-dependent receptor [Cyclobacteriaceae bacterium]|nr:TonB-dependent receptor [Cyclobacteriaceae bacterium]